MMDEDLAGRVRELIAPEAGYAEKRMFGGIAMMVAGHMAVAVSGRGGLMVRVAPDDAAGFLAEPGAEPMIMKERPMRGWLTVDATVLVDDAVLKRWVDRGVAFTRTLPSKSPPSAKKRQE